MPLTASLLSVPFLRSPFWPSVSNRHGRSAGALRIDRSDHRCGSVSSRSSSRRRQILRFDGEIRGSLVFIIWISEKVM